MSPEISIFFVKNYIGVLLHSRICSKYTILNLILRHFKYGIKIIITSKRINFIHESIKGIGIMTILKLKGQL